MIAWPVALGLLALLLLIAFRFVHTEAEETRELVRAALVLFACPLRALCPGCKVSVAYHPAQVQQTERPGGALFSWVSCPGCKGPVSAAGESQMEETP